MKKVILGICLLVFSTCLSQIKIVDVKEPQLIGEYKLMGTVHISLTKEDDTCTFTYADEKFTKIIEYKSFSFKSSDLETIYQLFISDQEKDSKKSVELEDGNIINIEFNKSMGSKYISIYHINKIGTIGLCRMNTKQMKKVFGRE